MKALCRVGMAEQTRNHLVRMLRSGAPGTVLPGVPTLARELGVAAHTVRAALVLLERDGLIASAGCGKRRRIAATAPKKTGLLVAVLLQDRLEDEGSRRLAMLVGIREDLERRGHRCVFLPGLRPHADPGSSVRRLIADTGADAWVVMNADSATLGAFGRSGCPTIAFGGNPGDAEIARTGSDILPCIEKAVTQLIELGHRRIVTVCPESWRKPTENAAVAMIRRRLDGVGVRARAYHLPEWDETREGFPQLLGSLFGVTPPTAMILTEPYQLTALLLFAGTRGIRIPSDLSVFVTNDDPTYTVTEPAVARVVPDYTPIRHHIVRWVAGVAQGRISRRKHAYRAAFVSGETLARPPVH